MEEELKDMPKALRILAEDIPTQGFDRAMCLRDAAAMIESLVMQRDEARKEAEWMRDMMDPWAECDDPSFSWENADVVAPDPEQP